MERRWRYCYHQDPVRLPSTTCNDHQCQSYHSNPFRKQKPYHSQKVTARFKRRRLLYPSAEKQFARLGPRPVSKLPSFPACALPPSIPPPWFQASHLSGLKPSPTSTRSPAMWRLTGRRVRPRPALGFRDASTAAMACRAVVLPRLGGPEVLEVRPAVGVPNLKPRDVLVRARAVSINPLDFRVSSRWHWLLRIFYLFFAPFWSLF